jgi:outer membrane protein assembly factor BamB
MLRRLRGCLIALLACAASHPLHADDWPQWLGPQRDGRWAEKGIVDNIPAAGLPVLWRTAVGGGYSGPAIAGGRVFVTDYASPKTEVTNDPSSRERREGKERIHCLSLRSGETLWTVEYPRSYNISYAAGPRTTPTVDGDRVYVLGAEGDLLCLAVANGNEIWKRQFQTDYKAHTPLWGHSAHPLVQGDLVYCLVGGPGSLVVAFNKMTGAEVWKALDNPEIGYCPPSVAIVNGKEQLIIWHPKAVCGLDLSSGKTLWTFPLAPQYDMSIGAPRFQGNKFFASGIGQVAAMVEFDAQGLPSKTLWQGGDIKKGVYAGNVTPLWIDDVIYGSDCGSGLFVAVDAKTGKRHWETYSLTAGGDRRASHGTGFMVQNDWRSFVLTETGHLVLAKLSKEGFEERGRMKVLEPTGECFGRPVVWAHPAFSDRTMVARNDKEIVCVDLAAKGN